MKRYILSTLIILSVQFSFAQDIFDALRYSQTEYGGTARSIAMGSAFGALGADFASASVNPAGLGLYRSNEFTLSPTLIQNQTESNYLGSIKLDNMYIPNFNNLSYVGTIKTGIETGIVSITFGFGYNQLKNFNSRQIIQTNNAETTLLNYYTDYANEIGDENSFDNYYEGLAWETALITKDTDPSVLEGVFYNDLTRYSSYDLYDGNGNKTGIGYEAVGIFPHSQKKVVTKKGRINEYDFSLGMNINHKVYVGATIGFADLEYTENSIFSEEDDQGLSNFLKDYALDTRFRDSGLGLNLKTGLIIRPIKPLRIGLAIHTPTFYNISRTEYKSLTSNFDQVTGNTDSGNGTNFDAEIGPDYFYYGFETPLKAIASAAYLFGEKALISIDYEWVNYSNSKFRTSVKDSYNFDYSNHNSYISKSFNSASNIRIGGEFRATPNVSLRAGYNLIGNPWKSKFTFDDGSSIDVANSNDSYSNYSAGIGYREKNFFIDFAYRLSDSNYTQQVHDNYYTNPNNGKSYASIKEMNHQATITFGFRF